jgi:hypothetical protein
MSRASVLERPIAVRAIALVGLFMLVAPLMLLLASRSADAATLCLPKKDETACIAGTMGSRADPIEGVDVILTKPDGTTETLTTEADGKFAFTVTEPGNYLVGVDPDSLPKGSELRPPADAKLAGPDGALKVDNVVLGQNYGATLTVREIDPARIEALRTDRLPLHTLTWNEIRLPSPDGEFPLTTVWVGDDPEGLAAALGLCDEPYPDIAALRNSPRSSPCRGRLNHRSRQQSKQGEPPWDGS